MTSAGARQAADELADLAAGSSSAVLHALSEHALGAVLLAEGDPASALGHLRAAAATWRQAHLPYDLARTLGPGRPMLRASWATWRRRRSSSTWPWTRSCGSGHSRTPTRSVRWPPIRPRAAGRSANPLSEREREVLAQVAAGRTNREIASALVISEHTVGRHLENIFAKLAVSSRAAAAAYGVEHGLL